MWVFISSAYTAAAIPSSAHTAAKETNKQICLLHHQRYKDKKKARTHFDYYSILAFSFLLIDTAATTLPILSVKIPQHLETLHKKHHRATGWV